MTNKIKTDGTLWDLGSFALEAGHRIHSLYASTVRSATVRSTTEWFENAAARESAHRSITSAIEEVSSILKEIKSAIGILQNTEIGLTASVDEIDDVRKALLLVLKDAEYIKNGLINRQTIIHEIDTMMK